MTPFSLFNLRSRRMELITSIFRPDQISTYLRPDGVFTYTLDSNLFELYSFFFNISSSGGTITPTQFQELETLWAQYYTVTSGQMWKNLNISNGPNNNYGWLFQQILIRCVDLIRTCPLNPSIVNLTTIPDYDILTGVLLPDGNVSAGPLVLYPNSNNYIYYNDYSTQEPGYIYSYTGCLLNTFNETRVFGVPYNSTVGSVFDYDNGQYIHTPAGFPTPTTMVSTATMFDGRVFCGNTRFSGNTNRIYDPVSNTITTPNGTITQGSYLFSQLLFDGRVLMQPWINSPSTSNILLYNPYTNALDNMGVSDNNGSPGSIGCCLLPNGNVYIIPRTGNTGRIYNPTTNTVTAAGGVINNSVGTNGFWNGRLMPDGRVFIPAVQNPTSFIYDPYLNSITSVNVSGIYSSVNLLDGNLLLIPVNVNTTPVRIYRTGRPGLPPSIQLSPLLNRG